MDRRYGFVSRWTVGAPPERCWDEVERMLRPGGSGAHWWPGVTVSDGPALLAAGEVLTLIVRSPLGYRLRVRLRLTEVVAGDMLAASSTGDLRGAGSLMIEPGAAAGESALTIRWDVATTRAWMNATGWLLRPAFERAHTRVMAHGEAGLRRALDGSV
ncbi:MAG TPA: hypothetical protein VIP54_06585 [Microterricola sp.]